MHFLSIKCKYLLGVSTLIFASICEAYSPKVATTMWIIDSATEKEKIVPKSANMLSAEGLNLIKTFEGFSAKVYNDIGGKPTIGYGHLLLPHEKYTFISEAEATVLLRHDLTIAENCVKDRLGSEYVTQGQYDAMVSLTYNWGCGNFAKSTLLKFMLQDRDEEAQKMLLRVDKVNGKVSKGLMRRRLAEEDLFDNEPELFHPNRRAIINKLE